MEKAIEKSALRIFFEKLKSMINEIDVDEDSGKGYENNSEFSALSATNQAELVDAQKSINEDEVNYAKVLKEEHKKILKQKKDKELKAEQAKQKASEYYSKTTKRTKKNVKSKDRDE